MKIALILLLFLLLVGTGFFVIILLNAAMKENEPPDGTGTGGVTPGNNIKSLKLFENRDLYDNSPTSDLTPNPCTGKTDLPCGLDSELMCQDRFSIIDFTKDKVIVDSVDYNFILDHTLGRTYAKQPFADYSAMKKYSLDHGYDYAAVITKTALSEKNNTSIYPFKKFKNMDNYIQTLPGYVEIGKQEYIPETQNTRDILECIERGKNNYDIVGLKRYNVNDTKDNCIGYGYKGQINDKKFPLIKCSKNEKQTYMACTNGNDIGGSTEKACSVRL